MMRLTSDLAGGLRARRHAGGAAIIVLVVLLAGCGSESGVSPSPNETPTEETYETPSPDPTETDPSNIPEAEMTHEQLVEKFKIPAGLEAEELAKVISEERITDWLNAGTGDYLRMARLDANKSWDEFLPPIAEKFGNAYAEALFGKDWRKNSEIADYVERSKTANLTVLKAYVYTAWSDSSEDVEAYREWVKNSETTESVDGDVREITVQQTWYNNSDKNRHTGDYTKKDRTEIYTVEPDGQIEVITRIEFVYTN